MSQLDPELVTAHTCGQFFQTQLVLTSGPTAGGSVERPAWDSDRTGRLHFHFSLSRTGEGNVNPLQCSCLENPRDSGAWWAAVSVRTESDMTEVT